MNPDRDVFMEAARVHRHRGYLLLMYALIGITLASAWYLLSHEIVHTVIVPGAADSRRLPISFFP